MLLLIDAGNTRVKWALARDDAAAGEWLASGASLHAELAGLSSHWQHAQPTRALLCNVAGADIAAQLEVLLADAGVAREAVRWFHSQAACAGVSNGYRDPSQLGSDRFASLIGARQRFASQALLVITAGTATTVDALDAAGHFIGGMILPGLGTMARSLALNTAQLPDIHDATLQQLFADNTHDAIISGCLHAQVGAITQALQQLPDARCLLSGGAAPYIAPHLPFSVEQIDNLVLHGLHTALLSETA
jgi:type III pantothenate kinase